MKIIDETKVKNEISKIEKVVNGKLSTAFEKGVEFAENELQEIAIEFSNWKELNVGKFSNASIGFYYKIKGDSEQYFYNNQLFAEFIKQRKA